MELEFEFGFGCVFVVFAVLCVELVCLLCCGVVCLCCCVLRCVVCSVVELCFVVCLC